MRTGDEVAAGEWWEVIERGPTRETGVTDWVTGVRTSTLTHGDVSRSFQVRLYTVTELVGELTAAGFASVDARAGLDGDAPPTPATRLLPLATR